MRVLSIVASVLLACVSGQALAAPKAFSSPVRTLPPPTADAIKIADEIARLVAPQNLMLEAMMAGWEEGVKDEQAAFDQLDAQAPGLAAKVTSRSKAELAALVAQRVPGLQAKLAAIYAANATADELGYIKRFFQSPAGSQFLRAMAMSNAGGDLGANGTVTTAELTSASQAAARDAVSSLSADQQAGLIEFMSTPGARPMKEIGKQVQPELAAWMNTLIKDYEARMGPILEVMISKALDVKN